MFQWVTSALFFVFVIAAIAYMIYRINKRNAQRSEAERQRIEARNKARLEKQQALDTVRARLTKAAHEGPSLYAAALKSLNATDKELLRQNPAVRAATERELQKGNERRIEQSRAFRVKISKLACPKCNKNTLWVQPHYENGERIVCADLDTSHYLSPWGRDRNLLLQDVAETREKAAEKKPVKYQPKKKTKKKRRRKHR